MLWRRKRKGRKNSFTQHIYSQQITAHNINTKREEHWKFHALFPDLHQDNAKFSKIPSNEFTKMFLIAQHVVATTKAGIRISDAVFHWMKDLQSLQSKAYPEGD